MLFHNLIPLTPGVDYTQHLTKIFILKCEEIIVKNSYVCRVYKSVVDRSLLRLYLTRVRKAELKSQRVIEMQRPNRDRSIQLTKHYIFPYLKCIGGRV